MPNDFDASLRNGALSRRDLLARTGQLAGLLAFGALSSQELRALSWSRRGHPAAYPFTLGVASGDPLSDGVVLWTRLAPDPLRGGGMPDAAVPVRWEIASDDRFRHIVQRGEQVAHPAMAHAVHVEVSGLEAGRDYWYRFMTVDAVSPIGRTRTAHGRGVSAMSFAFTSCQNYQAGYYTAHHHLAREAVDLVVHLGDYIYEGGIGKEMPRQHNSAEILTIADYRNRYALYKSDPELQAAHAASPWVVTWDDHEVDNNYAGNHEERGAPVEQFLLRRAAAYQAYYEHMPLRRTAMPTGPNLQLYRRLHFGELLALHMLDTRQHRTPQPCHDGFVASCAGAQDPAATILGSAQERWLLEGLTPTQARWNVVANQVPFVPVTRRRGAADWNGEGTPALSMDKWDGYAVQRARIHRHLRDAQVSNPIIITGDVHVSWVADIPSKLENPLSAPIGTEFVGTSISSGGSGQALSPMGAGLLADNPHARYFNGQRGYVRCRATHDLLTVDYRVVDAVERPTADITTHRSFIVAAGRPGVQPA
jgi:alkaline phosphatase D